MRLILLAFLLAAMSSAMTTGPAAARDYPFCIKGSDYDSSVGDCRFDTYAACAASASGRLAYCDTNPFFAGPGAPDRRRRGARAGY